MYIVIIGCICCQVEAFVVGVNIFYFIRNKISYSKKHDLLQAFVVDMRFMFYKILCTLELGLILTCSEHIGHWSAFKQLIIYMFVAITWKISYVCKLLGMLLMSSIQISTLSTLVIALDTFVAIVLKPFQMYSIGVKNARILAVLCWPIGCICPVLAMVFPIRNYLQSICVSLGRTVTLPISVLYICFNLVTSMLL